MPVAPLETNDREQLETLARQVLQACPDMREQARQVASDLLKGHTLQVLDPDQVYFHRFHSAKTRPLAFSGWVHRGHPSLSLTLPQLVMQRFDVHDQDNADLLGYLSGFYTDGPEMDRFDEHNEVPLAPRDVMTRFWNLDFSERFHQQLGTFWATHSEAFRTLAKANFIASMLEECAAEPDQEVVALYRRVAQALAGPLDTPPTLAHVRAQQAPGEGIRLSTFDIGGYEASDILRIVLPSGQQLLYTPGEVEALHLFNDATALHWWILQRTNEAQNRARFMAHFPLACHHEKGSAVGLNHLIDLLFYGWSSDHNASINTLDKTLAGDAFSHLRDAARQRMLDDAAIALHSNADLRKQLWIGYLATFGRLASGLAAVDWPVALAVIGGGLAETGLSIDQSINGHTTAERKAGLLNALLAAIDTLFNATLLGAEPSITEDIPVLEPEPAPGLETERIAAPVPQPGWVPTALLPAEPDALLSPFETNVLLDGSPPDTGTMRGIYTHDAAFYVMIDEVAYQVRAVGETRSWVIIDPGNPYSFYRNVPIRLDANGQWQPLSNGLKGGAPPVANTSRRAPAPAPQAAGAPTAYEIPDHWRVPLREGANGGDRNYLSGYFTDVVDPLRNTPYERFRSLRDTLCSDAQAFFAAPSLPPRPPIVVPASNSRPKALFRSLYAHSQGLVVGEVHSELGSKRLLIDHMAQLARQKVRVLYLEHLLSDFHQVDLDAFHRTGTLSRSLQDYVHALDRAHATDPDRRYTFLEVLRAAQKHGVRIQAIDCMVSYRQAWLHPPTQPVRQQMMNYYAHRIIHADQAAHGPQKWIALVGNSHANTYKGVPGLAELEGMVGLRVEDRPSGQPDHVGIDPGRSALMSDVQAVQIKSDLRLLAAVANPGTAPTLAVSLRNAGAFTFRDFDGQFTLVHRRSEGLLVNTPVRTEGQRVYIECPDWPWIHQRRLGSAADLVAALNAHGLKYVVT